jgi:hypothetical protein
MERYVLETGRCELRTGDSFEKYVSDAILKVSCLTTQSSDKISDTEVFVLLDRVGTDSSRESRY